MSSIIAASANSESSSCTDAKLIRFSHKWTINHFSFHLEDEDSEFSYIKSAKFSPATNSEMQFSLRLYPKNKEDGEEVVGAHIYLEKCDREEIVMNCKISILNAALEQHNIEGMFPNWESLHWTNPFFSCKY